jgi:hypothetical protein
VAQDKETTHVLSAAFAAMQQFCAANSDAIGLLHTAAHDYAAARCLLINGLVSGGLVMGSQAIEKRRPGISRGCDATLVARQGLSDDPRSLPTMGEG